jgi:protein N-terminal glutamine amidohydrolase
MIDRSLFAYASCYCEENVWHLAGDPRIEGDARFVVFISNRDRTCPVWSQRAAPDPNRPALWDYHVVYLVEAGSEALVYDLDTTLEFPCRLDAYLRSSFPHAGRIERSLAPRFRVIEADRFRATFASDRSHMTEHGRWKAVPPPWPLIRTAESAMNLDRFVDVESTFDGELFDLEGLRRRFVRAKRR